MSDVFTSVSSEGWFSRLGKSIKGIIVGFIIFLVSFVILFWNEGRAVHRARALEEVEGKVVSVEDTSTVDSSFDQKVVHLSGMAQSNKTLTDATFHVSGKVIRLERDVEMFQWIEKTHKKKKKKVGGGTKTTTTYSYEKDWKKGRQDSENFHKKDYNNPHPKFKSQNHLSSDVEIGAYRLSNSLISKISNASTVPLGEEDFEKLDEEIKSKTVVVDGMFYIGQDGIPAPTAPKVGDMRIRFRITEPAEISFISQMVGDTFQPYKAKDGTVEEFRMGIVSQEAILEKAKADNVVMTWVLRLVGLIVMTLGMSMVLSPIAVLADVVPFFGGLARGVIFVVCLLLAICFSMITIGIAWLFYRPLLAIGLFAIGGLAIFAMIRVVKAFRPEPAAVDTMPPVMTSGGAGDMPEIVE